MGVSAILPTSATSVPKIVSLSSCVLTSGSVDLNPPKQHTLLGYHTAPSAFAANVASFFVLSNVQGKAILLGEPARRVWLPSPRTSPRKPEEPFSVLNALGVLLFRAFFLLPRPLHFRRAHHSCTSHENLLASALCFSAFEEPSCIPCNLRV
jgi:hypothetical protein